MKIWIHIGHGKTGTTSIQKFLVDSRPELKEQGFLYPHVGQSKYSHHGLAIFQAPKMSPKILGLYQELMNEIVTEKPKTLLLSSEQFCYCKFDYIRELKDLFADYEVGVVFYVRNQVALIPSAYMQTLKHGGNYYGGIKDYFSHTKNAFLYSRRIEHWVKLFGDENLKVRLYDSWSDSKKLIESFCETIGFSSEGFSGTQVSNPSIPDFFSELIVAFYDACENVAGRRRFIDTLLRLLPQSNFETDQNLDSLLKKMRIIYSKFKAKKQSTEQYDLAESRLKIFPRVKNELAFGVDAGMLTEIRDYYRKDNKQFAERYMRPDERKAFLGN